MDKDSIAIAVAKTGVEPPRFVGTVGPTLAPLLKALAGIGAAPNLRGLRGGPYGCGVVRELRARGYACDVIAAAKIPRWPGDRVKTDRRDCL